MSTIAATIPSWKPWPATASCGPISTKGASQRSRCRDRRSASPCPWRAEAERIGIRRVPVAQGPAGWPARGRWGQGARSPWDRRSRVRRWRDRAGFAQARSAARADPIGPWIPVPPRACGWAPEVDRVRSTPVRRDGPRSCTGRGDPRRSAAGAPRAPPGTVGGPSLPKRGPRRSPQGPRAARARGPRPGALWSQAPPDQRGPARIAAVGTAPRYRRAPAALLPRSCRAGLEPPSSRLAAPPSGTARLAGETRSAANQRTPGLLTLRR